MDAERARCGCYDDGLAVRAQTSRRVSRRMGGWVEDDDGQVRTGPFLRRCPYDKTTRMGWGCTGGERRWACEEWPAGVIREGGKRRWSRQARLRAHLLSVVMDGEHGPRKSTLPVIRDERGPTVSRSRHAAGAVSIIERRLHYRTHSLAGRGLPSHRYMTLLQNVTAAIPHITPWPTLYLYVAASPDAWNSRPKP
jgi:hypothetical protein